jgi:predicted Rossmann-fold nucleotide-binding protein
MDRVLADRTVAVLGSGTDEHDVLAREIGRNHINVLSAAAIVALPGELGTASEVQLAVDYDKPVIAYSPNEELIGHFVQSVPRATTLREVEEFLTKFV